MGGNRRDGTEAITKILVRNCTRESVVAESTDLANTSARRRKGLLGRDALHPGEGLWIVPCEAIHTFFMRFPIDVVYLDRKKRVKKLRSNVIPCRLSACFGAHSVLELPVGAIVQSGTKRGDQLDFHFS